MTTVDEPVAIDSDKLMAFVFQAVGEVGGTLNTALVVMGDRLGLYNATARAGPLTPAELAQRTGTAERYVREWLNAQAAGGFVTYDPDSGRYTLPAEQAVALTDPSSPAYLPGFFQIAKLRRGARVADVGCGHGASTILMAQAFPNSTFVGSDYHADSIATARQRAAEARLGERVTFEVAPAASFSGRGYDLVTMFDYLHDMGDPVGAARHVRDSLAPDGTWMIVEPAAGDRVEDNLNPIGRAYYAFSTLLCTPASQAQDVGMALGAQAGEARIRDVVTTARG